MGAKFAITTEGARALTASSTKTMLELLGAASVQAVLCELGFSLNGVTATDAPVLVELYKITATGTATALTEEPWSRNGPTAQCAGKVLHTVEPTKGNRIASWYIHPQGGNLLVQWPLGREPVVCDGSASQGVAIVYTSPTLSATTNCTAYMVWEE